MWKHCGCGDGMVLVSVGPNCPKQKVDETLFSTRFLCRQNAKLREKGKKEESKRLRDFVENAYKIVPRVLQHKEELKQERCVVSLSHTLSRTECCEVAHCIL